MGSPRGVPVPWTATARTAAGPVWAADRAETSSRVWAGPLGAVRLLDLPSWFTADPAMMAAGRVIVEGGEAAAAGASTAATKASPLPYLQGHVQVML